MVHANTSLPTNAGLNEERKAIGRKKKELKRIKYYYASDNEFSDSNKSLPAVDEGREKHEYIRKV